MYHISDIKRFRKCPRLYYLSQINQPEYIQYLRNDETLTPLIKEYLDIKDCYEGCQGDPKDRVLKSIEKYEWFIKPRFEFDRLRIKIPVLHKTDNGFDVYFTLGVLYPKEDDVDYYRYHIYVLEKNQIKVNHIYIIHLNAKYVFKEHLDVEKLFLTSTDFYNSKNHKVSKIKNKIRERNVSVIPYLNAMDQGSLEDYPPRRVRFCKGRQTCPFYHQCFEETELPDDSILHLVASRYKNQMYQKGILYLKDADSSLVEGNKCQYAQIMASKNGGLYYDYYPLKTWLDAISARPLVFIDFEWERYLIPQFEGLKPYDVVCFEYSIHILNENGEVTHNAFIGTGDDREDFIKALLRDVPKGAKLVAYNAVGAEVLRIKELAAQFPKYANELLDIAGRFVDMSDPFLNGMIYHTKMRGNYSVKSLLNVVSDLTYKDLSISNGMDAVLEWRKIDRHETEGDENIIKNDLIEYCSLDSYSLYLIYKWLVKIITDK